MCFVIHPRYPKSRVAKKGIVCYKEGYRRDVDSFTPYFNTTFIYRLGEITKLPFTGWPVRSEVSAGCIYTGFHSFSNKKVLRKYRGVTSVKCIIPPGARYYYNPIDKEYVSDQIIVQEFMP